jgi:hypothetical protein
MNRRRLVSLVALAAFILAAPLTALGGSPASVCPAGLTGSFPLCSIMPTFAGVNAESRLLPSGELGAETFLRTEDLTTYTEVDENTEITIADDTVTFDGVGKNDESYVYKDFGTDYFSGDFVHRFKLNMTSFLSNAPAIGVWALANAVGDRVNVITTQSEQELTVIATGPSAGPYTIGIFEYLPSADSSDSLNLSFGTDYYIEIERDESVGTYGTVYLRVYSDADYSTLVDSTSLGLGEKVDFRYVYSLQSGDGSENREATGTISNLQLDTATYFNGVNVVKANGGEARFEPTGLKDEPESTNLLKSSRLLDVDAANWGGALAAEDCVQNEVGIDGVANTAWTLTDDDASAAEYIRQIYAKAADDVSEYTFSSFVKKTTSATIYPYTGFYFSGGTPASIGVIIDTNNGVLYDKTGAGPNSKSIYSYGDWWRVSITDADPNGDNTNISLYIHPARASALDGSLDNTATGSNVFDFAQLENRSTATSPIYTTSTAVTRPADSFSLTMSDAFKEKFAEALGDELAPDFGAVLGDELITDENDRTFSDGDVGNWTIGESGSAASLDYDTSSIGGHDDKQIKLTAEAGEDYVLARLTTSYTPDMSAGYYILSAKVYLDPNADQDRIRLYASSFTGSTKIQSLDGAGSDYSTVNKGVWENVYSIFELVSGDLEGSFRIGFFDSGNLTANDICYFDDISLRKITFSDDWTAGDGWGPKFALTAPSLGDEELSNGDFSSVTEGSDLVTNGGFDADSDWSKGSGWSIGSGVATWTFGSGNGNLGQTILTAGHQYRITYDVTANTGDQDFKLAVGTDASQTVLPQTVDTGHSVDFIAAGTDFLLRCTNGTGGAISIDNIVVKEITLDGHDTPTVDADDYLEYDTDNDRVRLVATDGNAKLRQTAVTVGTLYYYEIDIETVTSGRIKLVNTDCETYDKPINDTNTVVKMSTSGVHSGVFRAGNTVVEIVRDAFPTDTTINSWSIKPYTPSHANTDPRFDRQTEGSDVLDGEGAFDAVGTWLEAPNASIGAGVLSCTGTGGISDNDNRTSINASLVEDVRYKITFDVTAYTSGQIRIDAGYDAEYLISSPAVQTYTIYLTCSGNSFFYIRVNGTLTIDNVAIVPVTLTDYTGTNWYPYDENGGAIHVTGAAAGMQQTISSISEGDYVLVILKHSGRTAGGVAVYAGGTNTGLGVTVDGVYSAIAKWGSADYVNIYPSGIYDGVFEYCYIIPLSTPVAHCTGSQSAASNLSTGSNILVADANHKNVFTVDNRSAGTVKVYNGGLISSAGHGNPGPAVSSDDTYTHYLTESFERAIYVQANADFVGDITALSVKEVTRHAKGTGIAVWTPGYTESDLGGTGTGYNIIGVDDATAGMVYLNANTNHYLTSYDGANIALGPLNWTNTPYLIVWQWGDVLSNVNNMRIGAAAIDSPWDGTGYRSDVEFDGSFSLGTDLNLFYSKFGSNNLRDLMFFDSILTDAEIENIRRRIK